MNRILTYETERKLGEALVWMDTGWAVSTQKIADLLHSIKRDLRIGVRHEALPRKIYESSVDENTVPHEATRLTDAQVQAYEKLIEDCRTTVTGHTLAVAFKELLDKYRDLTE